MNKDELCPVSRFWQGLEGLSCPRGLEFLMDSLKHNSYIRQTRAGQRAGFPMDPLLVKLRTLGAGDIAQLLKCLLSILKLWVHPQHHINWV